MNTEIITGKLTAEDTAELAKACMDNMTDDDQVQLIREMCLADQDFTDELVANIEELTSQ